MGCVATKASTWDPASAAGTYSVDPDDIRRVFFRRPDTRLWHTLYWTKASAFDLPMSEDGAQYARRLAKARGKLIDPDAALEAMLDEWDLGLGRSAAERRIALRMSRERATLLGDLTTEDDADAKALVEATSTVSTSTPKALPSASTSRTQMRRPRHTWVD